MEDIELEVRTMPTDDLSGTVVFTTKLVATNSGESNLLKCLRFRSQIATNKDKRYFSMDFLRKSHIHSFLPGKISHATFRSKSHKATGGF